MSYYHFMACSRELRCGDYIRPPKAIYPSYVDYMRSEDYHINLRLPDSAMRLSGRRMGGLHFPTDPSKAVGSVYVYEKSTNERPAFLRPFPNPDEWTQEVRSFIAAQFTLPYMYTDAFGPKEVCQFLQPGDQVEVLSIFLGHDAPLEKPVPCTIDLQPFVDGTMSLRDLCDPIAPPPANNLIRYIPPRTPCKQKWYIIHDTSDCICRVYGDVRDEMWEFHKLRDQNLL